MFLISSWKLQVSGAGVDPSRDIGSEMELEIFRGSILDVDVEVIVNPANSRGWMAAGLAAAIKRAAGADVEKEAVEKGPIPVGSAIITSGGKTKFRSIIHAPTMQSPLEKIGPVNVLKAVIAALSLADESGYSSLALPGMGTGQGGVDPRESAKMMINAIKTFQSSCLKKIILVDARDGIVDAWKKFDNLWKTFGNSDL